MTTKLAAWLEAAPLSEVGAVPASESREACEVWEVPAGSEAIHYAVSNRLEHLGVYRVDFPAGAIAGRR